jgi:pyrroloquinoline quinone biosynthesis protein E
VSFRPYALLAEITYRCPLHCPYCSNPTVYPSGTDLSVTEWCRVIDEAADLGVVHVGFSGGEPLLHTNLPDLIRHARQTKLYTNLITSGIGLTEQLATQLQAAGLDSLQISFQSDQANLANEIAGTQAHEKKITAVRVAQEANFALSANVVLHRNNIERLPQIVDFILSLGIKRLELANAQYYGWALLNRAHLLPTREQVTAADDFVTREKERLRDHIEIFYVLPDYFMNRPKACMNGWGQRYLTVNPKGEVLPCPNAASIPNLRFDNVRSQPLTWIWNHSQSFNQFRGEEWMTEPCRSCPERTQDFGGCRCQAALLTGDAANTDPVCDLSPHRTIVDAIFDAVNGYTSQPPSLTARQNPSISMQNY